MSYNGSGTFVINTTGQPVVAGTVISSAAFNALTADLATGLTTALTKDGQTTATARIPFAQGITSTLVTDASSTTTGSIITAGGVGIAKKLYIGGEINYGGVTLTNGVTGTGKMVLDTTPTLVTPILGTPTSGTLTNVSGLPPAGVVGTAAIIGANTFTAAQEWATGSSIASAATINLNTATGNRVHITGTTAITAVTLTRGPRTVIFDGVLTLTHNATTNNLPGAANITTAAGDRAIYESDGTTVYCVSYTKVSGTAVISAGGGAVTIASGSFPSATSLSITNIPATYVQLVLQITDASTSGAGQFLNIQVSTDNGSSYDTTANSYQGSVLNGSTVAAITRATLVQGNSLAAAESATGVVSIFSYQGGAYPQFIGRTSNSTNDKQMSIGTYTGSTSAINALKLSWTGGNNFDLGSYVLQGIS